MSEGINSTCCSKTVLYIMIPMTTKNLSLCWWYSVLPTCMMTSIFLQATLKRTYEISFETQRILFILALHSFIIKKKKRWLHNIIQFLCTLNYYLDSLIQIIKIHNNKANRRGMARYECTVNTCTCTHACKIWSVHGKWKQWIPLRWSTVWDDDGGREIL